jgi:hypothetical protein
MKDLFNFEPGGVYYFVALARKQENESITENTQKLRRKVITSEDEINEAIMELAKITSSHDELFRLYVSYNRRDALTAAKLLRERMDDWLLGVLNGDDEMREKFARLGSEYRSCLAKPECRDESRVLIDVDEKGDGLRESLRDQLSELTTIRYEVETPNGYHFVVDGFDPRLFDPEVEYERKPDSWTFISYL